VAQGIELKVKGRSLSYYSSEPATAQPRKLRQTGRATGKAEAVGELVEESTLPLRRTWLCTTSPGLILMPRRLVAVVTNWFSTISSARCEPRPLLLVFTQTLNFMPEGLWKYVPPKFAFSP
jgi:hypothetical protein